MDDRWIVPKVEDGMDRESIYATTYQMRNPFSQFADGVVTELEVHCFFQHQYAANLARIGAKVLDVCCGRGLLIPFLRYNGHPPALYVGVDIEPRNARWRENRDPRRESNVKDDWGFNRIFMKSDVASMAKPIQVGLKCHPFDLIVYTSSIEHMQPKAQQQSLVECHELGAEGTVLYLTCPVSDEGETGYDAQYAAHVYEPTRSELTEWLGFAGWQIRKGIGLSTKSTKFRQVLTGHDLEQAELMYDAMPRAQALPAIAALFPHCATEMAYVCDWSPRG